MRVLHVSKYYDPVPGGIETVVKSMAEGLHRKNVSCTVICANESLQDSQETVNGINVVRCGTFVKVWSQPITPSLVFKLPALIKAHDIVHLHSPNPLSEFLLFLLCPHEKLIVTYHADIVRQRLALPFYRKFMQIILRKARRITVASPQLKASSFFLKGNESRTIVVPFGLDRNTLTADSQVRAEAEKLNSKFGAYGLFVGRLVGYKGLPTLIEAARKTSGTILIVGEGPQRQELEAKIKEYGLESRVFLRGFAESRESLLAHYVGARYFVLPSLTSAEAYDMVLVEALSFGLPLISTRLGTGVEFVNAENETGLVITPGGSSDLAAAINRLDGDATLRERFSKNAAERYRTHFDSEKMVEHLLKIYSEKS